MIRLIVVDDEELIRSAIVALLELEDDLEVVGSAGDGATALAVTTQTEPDVVLLDLEMPGADGVETAQSIHRCSRARTIIVTRHARPGVLRRALSAGVSGFIPKSSPVSKVADAVREVAAGRRCVDPEIAAVALTAADCTLTVRELEALRLTRRHDRVRDIAEELFLAEGTVRNYLSSAMAKVDARTRHEAARIAWDRGWI
jgi:two-component system, NarL family, response regulator DesR